MNELVAQAETEEKIIGRKRIKGMSLHKISEEMGLTFYTTRELYNKFLEINKRELLKSKGKKVSEINARYEHKMDCAEKGYQNAMENGQVVIAGNWHKSMLETLRDYVQFLKSIGYFTDLTAQEIDDDLKRDNSSPLMQIVNEHMERLKQKMISVKGETK